MGMSMGSPLLCSDPFAVSKKIFWQHGSWNVIRNLFAMVGVIVHQAVCPI